MANMAAEPLEMVEHSLFTCLSCAVAFPSADEQRNHYKTDYHRYNMKRRVASLPPVSAAIFNQKVLERRQDTAVMSSALGSFCDACRKNYSTENAYRSHLNSKKHREAELKAATQVSQKAPGEAAESEKTAVSPPSNLKGKAPALTVDEDATEEDVEKTIDERLAAVRNRISVKDCLFCTHVSFSMEDNLKHMDIAHSFFIPDSDYLVDLTGLITYLGEKIAVGNVCIYCNARSRDFRSLDAVRKHMVDKSHCRIAYGTDKDKLEVSDFYDFSSSYPDAEQRKKGKGVAVKKTVVAEASGSEDEEEDEEWEDVDDDADDAGSVPPDSEEDEDEELPGSGITYGDSPFELVLSSGARIGHRSLRRYYAQNLTHTLAKKDDRIDPKSGAALVKRLVSDKKSDLVPVKGGFGAFGSGTQVVKARNRGEAREAGKHIRQFRDQRKREEFKTKVGFIHNSQKHFRDPLLQ
ncbi:hypothetical protein SCHPADRAFT_866780 [Schizopora paradoxa]|uniref:C2H2-type domain-containing protein n=1 Tax=Schizopora paradoxa TaxID=27342 RepID=A0A0H2S393_9AGAM|nr:hypothetical protein SCHPADRAFT_866780 [Schizopora paradoxa]